MVCLKSSEAVFEKWNCCKSRGIPRTRARFKIPTRHAQEKSGAWEFIIGMCSPSVLYSQVTRSKMNWGKKHELFQWMHCQRQIFLVPLSWMIVSQQFILPFFAANIGQTVHQLLVIQALRPDRVRAMGHILVGTVLGEEFMHDAEQGLDLASVVEHEVWISVLRIRYQPLSFFENNKF